MRRAEGAAGRWWGAGLLAGVAAGCADPTVLADGATDIPTADRVVVVDVPTTDTTAPVDELAVDAAIDVPPPPLDAPDASDAGDRVDAPDVVDVAVDAPVAMDVAPPLDVPPSNVPDVLDAPDVRDAPDVPDVIDVPAADRGSPDAGVPSTDGGACVAWPACTGPGFGTALGSDLQSDYLHSDPDLGDFDGDGRLDLITLLDYPIGFGVSRGLGGGVWAPPVRIGTSSTESEIVTGEFTGDAYDDVVTRTGSSLGMWRGTAAGLERTTSLSSATLTVGTPLVTADFDGDRRSDVARGGVNTANTPVVEVYLIGASIRRVEVPLPAGPYHLGAGDLDGDGRAELIATTTDANTMVAVSNIATSPTVTTIRGAGARVSYLVAANLTDAPGRELAVMTASGLQLFEREGGGWVGPTELEPIPGSTLAVADFDGDGREDVVSAFSWWRPFYDLRVYRGTARRGDVRASVYPISDAVRGVVVRDVDGDRAPDITLVQRRNPRTYVSFLRNRGGRFDVPAFLRPGTTNTTAGEPRTSAGDLDGDGSPEVVATDVSAPEAVVVYRREACGYAPVQRVPLARRLARFQLVDIDRDGDLDFLGSHEGGITIFWRERGAFNPTATTRGGASTIATYVGDLEGDGDRDIVTQQAGGVVIHRASAPGVFDPATAPSAISIFGLWDLDGDGRAEVIERTTNGFTITHEDRGTWTRGWAYAHPETAQVEIRTAADVTGDGRLDLLGVLVVRSTTTTVVFPGAAGGTFGAPLTSPIAPPPGATLRLGDVNGDGRTDVAWHLSTTQIGLGDGTGRFTSAPGLSTLAGGQTFDLIDLNGDGRPDIVGGDPSGTAVVVAHCAP